MENRFDMAIDRRGTSCIKYDCAVRRGKPADVLPLWVADMDFMSSPAVLEALSGRVSHGIFGYSEAYGHYFDALRDWYRDSFGWTPELKWLVKTPGVVFAIAMAVRAFTREGDSVLLQQPVYYPFIGVVQDNGRHPVNSPLVYENGVYRVNLKDFEQKIIDNNVKLFLLCSPHNPVGRVWTREELTAMGDICLRHGVTVLADEIHADFVWPGNSHTVFASLGDVYAQNSVVCTAPSKTFNLAGLQVSNIFIKNPDLRLKFRSEIDKTGYSQLNVMGLVACEAAYAHGREWLEELKTYLLGNISYVRRFLRECLPQIKLVEPQGTYLLWLDFRDLGLTEVQREELLLQKAGLWLDSGMMFGSDGEGFERINIACPRKNLQMAMEKLESALRK